MSFKKALKEKELATRRLLCEVVQQINLIPDEAVAEVIEYVRRKLTNYERDLQAAKNGNGQGGSDE